MKAPSNILWKSNGWNRIQENWRLSISLLKCRDMGKERGDNCCWPQFIDSLDFYLDLVSFSLTFVHQCLCVVSYRWKIFMYICIWLWKKSRRNSEIKDLLHSIPVTHFCEIVNTRCENHSETYATSANKNVLIHPFIYSVNLLLNKYTFCISSV